MHVFQLFLILILLFSCNCWRSKWMKPRKNYYGLKIYNPSPILSMSTILFGGMTLYKYISNVSFNVENEFDLQIFRKTKFFLVNSINFNYFSALKHTYTHIVMLQIRLVTSPNLRGVLRSYWLILHSFSASKIT